MPDYRGLFLRGTGGNAAGLGVQQGDAIRNITASFTPNGIHPYPTSLHPSMEMLGALRRTIRTSHHTGGFNNEQGYAFDFDASRVVPTANENRPVNKAVRYLIRAKP